MSYVHGSTELNEHLEASQALAKAKVELRNVRSSLWAFIDKPGKPWSVEKGDAKLAEAKDKVIAAVARVKAAHVRYTDPFRVKPQNRIEGE
jgi:hypothetical protein